MSRRSRAALARSAGIERLPVALIGGLAAAAGAGALALGWLRAQHPVADPAVLRWLRDHQTGHQIWAMAGALVLGVLLLGAGLWWAARSVRPEPRPDLVLDGPVTVTADAIAGAVRADAESVDGVGDARARVVRAKGAPALRLRLGLADGADVGAVWRQLDDRVVDRARRSLGVEALPTAVTLDVRSASGLRVR